MNSRALIRTLPAMIAGLLMWSCANIGSPEGGPRDYTPPSMTKSSPATGTLNFKGNKATLHFDEIVNLKDQQKKVIVSPPQKNAPSIKSVGKDIIIEFNDTMRPNTTYTVDFGDAIEDNNEGNRLEGFCYSFSTGDVLDTLQISGMVLRAKDLEPMQHVLVGIHSNLSDTAFTSLPFERICRTNDKGEFTMRNLKAGQYRIFALNDADGNYKMARSEDYAFVDSVIVPGVSSYTSNDTIWTFDHRQDSIKYDQQHTEFLPNDILLSMFNERYTPLYLKKTDRPTRNKLLVQVSGKSEMPTLDIISPAVHKKNWCVTETREGNDSTTFWLSDSTLIKSDSIIAAVHYRRTDSIGSIVEACDTVTFATRKTNAQIKQEKQEKKEKEELAKELQNLAKEREKLMAEGKETTEVDLNIKALKQKQREFQDKESIKPTMTKSGLLDVNDSIAFKFDLPIKSVAQHKIRLKKMNEDSTWVAVPTPALQQAGPYEPMRYVIPMSLEPETDYKLAIDSAAIISIYDQANDSLEVNFKTKSPAEYGSIIMHINAGDSAVVELLDGSDKVLRRQKVNKGTVDFQNLLPADYYMRLIVDTNGNGKWDTGNYATHTQPEEVYYYPTPGKIKVRKSLEREETWDIYATPLNLQKPEAVKKHKPETRKDLLEKKENKKNDEEDEFNSTGFGNNGYSGNKYRDYQNNRR